MKTRNHFEIDFDSGDHLKERKEKKCNGDCG